ncbi:MAG: hypothetical protein N3J91_04175 [Verrucomicrobiae bacterium]|nr:hypothetical protein [Verrucomicrobiae bacterium]
MTYQEHLSENDLIGAVTCLQAQIKSNPGDTLLRQVLFQCLCLQAKWDQAVAQLDVLQSLSHEWQNRSVIFQGIIESEKARERVFQGMHSIPLYGAAEYCSRSWIAGCERLTQGKYDEVSTFYEQGLSSWPQFKYKINDQHSSWFSDADTRVGPFIEAFLQTRYYWIPNYRLKMVIFSPVERLHDLVWRRAEFWLADGLHTHGFVPVRYPGASLAWSGKLLMSGHTEWETVGEKWLIGMGQRLWMTDWGDQAFLEVHKVEQVNT